MGLSDAREAARVKHIEVVEGVDPNEEKREAKREAIRAARMQRKLSDVLDDYERLKLSQLRRGSQCRRALVSETMACSANILSGASKVVIGGPSVQVLPITPEVPAWLSTTMQVMAIGGTLLATGGIAATYGIGTAVGSFVGGLAGGELGAHGGGWLADQMGMGATGRAIMTAGGGLIGGMAGGGPGFRGGRVPDVRSRRATASEFYARQGYAKSDIPDHLKGIDMTRPVTVETLPKGTRVVQYQTPGGRQGNYYAPLERRQTNLGSPRRVFRERQAQLLTSRQRHTSRSETCKSCDQLLRLFRTRGPYPASRFRRAVAGRSTLPQTKGHSIHGTDANPARSLSARPCPRHVGAGDVPP